MEVFCSMFYVFFFLLGKFPQLLFQQIFRLWLISKLPPLYFAARVTTTMREPLKIVVFFFKMPFTSCGGFKTVIKLFWWLRNFARNFRNCKTFLNIPVLYCIYNRHCLEWVKRAQATAKFATLIDSHPWPLCENNLNCTYSHWMPLSIGQTWNMTTNNTQTIFFSMNGRAKQKDLSLTSQYNWFMYIGSECVHFSRFIVFFPNSAMNQYRNIHDFTQFSAAFCIIFVVDIRFIPTYIFHLRSVCSASAWKTNKKCINLSTIIKVYKI